MSTFLLVYAFAAGYAVCKAQVLGCFKGVGLAAAPLVAVIVPPYMVATYIGMGMFHFMGWVCSDHTKSGASSV